MNLEALQKRAMEINTLFDARGIKQFGRPWTREEIMQGFVGDVGDLMKLIMAKAGIRHKDNIDEKLAHELADCLWSVLVLAEKYEIDLQAAFDKTMNELENTLTEI